MVRLTIADRVKIVKTYYENGNSAAATYRALCGDFARFNRPTQQAIGKIVKKFEETGSVTDIVRPVHNRSARSTSNIAAVKESLAKNPNLSIPERAQHLGLSYGSVWRILHLDLNQNSPTTGNIFDDLHLQKYKVQLTQELKPTDHELRRNFADWMLEQQALRADFSNRIIFSGEAHFSLDGYVHNQICRVWGSETPQLTEERSINTEKVIVWCGFCTDGVIGPYFFENDKGDTSIVTPECHESMIRNFFWSEIENMNLKNMWFQQDDSISHTTPPILSLLQEKFPGRVISSFGDVNWPPRSCDLTPLDFFLWGYVKDHVYAEKPASLECLKNNIRKVLTEIQPKLCQSVIKNYVERIECCRRSRGGHLNDVVYSKYIDK